ncbi:chloride anion exchanger-like [Chiloscyllium plagiosum]|uniref:chloride anion exchanger-like n=1 Tax=Chiloscyllium plagiosum TaxID=36176 RepID=UPI001CB86412|nr:chloride anion exchanger-like [Chiloscyllium plagiosum]
MLSGNQHYIVARPAYSEVSFKEHNQQVERYHKTIWDHVRIYFRCSTAKAKRIFYTFLPIASWLPGYNVKEWLPSDLVSGVSTGLVSVLQGLAFALLVNVPAGYGLYSAFFPVLTYCVLGTSKHLSVGPFPVLSLMVGTVVNRLVTDGNTAVNSTLFPADMSIEDRQVWVASSVTLLAGIFQLALGLLQVGFIVIYLSDPMISGFTTAAAIHVLISQLKFVLQLNVPGFNGPLSVIYTLEYIFNHITETNVPDVIISLIIMVVVFIVKEINDRFKSKLPVPIPIEVIMTIIATGVSYAFNFNEKYDVDIIGNLTSGYQSPLTPNMGVLQQSVGDAFSIAIVGFAVAFSVAKVYAIKHDYVLDGNQELVAFGVSNMFCGAFRGFAGSTALSRTAVQESTGGKTQLASLISAVMVMIVTLAIGFLLAPLPKSVLGALVIINLKGMLMQFREIGILWKKDKFDCLVWIMAFIAAVLLGLDIGLGAGVGFELLTVVFRTQFPQCSVLANISGTDIYKNRKDYLNIYEPEGVKIFRCPSPIFFANVDFLRSKLIEAIGFNPLRILRKRNKALKKIKKMLRKGELVITSKGYVQTADRSQESDSENEDNNTIEELDKATDMKELPMRIDWKLPLPAGLCVPTVEIHSIVLDFAAVSFLDVSAMKGLKSILKEFFRIEIDVYIAACGDLILAKLKSCEFFDDEISPKLFFLTIHDAMLCILDKHDPSNSVNIICDKVHNIKETNSEGDLKKRNFGVQSDTKF